MIFLVFLASEGSVRVVVWLVVAKSVLVVSVAVRSLVLVVEGRSMRGGGEASKVEGMFKGMAELTVAMVRE